MVDQAHRRVPPVPSVEWLTGLPPATRFAFHGGAAARAAVHSIWGVLGRSLPSECAFDPCDALDGSR
jgi:hypothetical protein